MKINDEGRSNAAYWYERAMKAEARLQKIMARCADLLDEDQFNELDAMVTGQPSREIIQQAKECGCGICDACVAASRPR
jgi:cytochrome c553